MESKEGTSTSGARLPMSRLLTAFLDWVNHNITSVIDYAHWLWSIATWSNGTLPISTHPISEMVSNDYAYSGMIPIRHSVVSNLAERPNTKRKFYNMEKESNKKRKIASEQYTQICLQNDIGEVSIHMLNNDCLRHIFLFLPIMDRVRIERDEYENVEAIIVFKWEEFKKYK